MFQWAHLSILYLCLHWRTAWKDLAAWHHSIYPCCLLGQCLHWGLSRTGASLYCWDTKKKPPKNITALFFLPLSYCKLKKTPKQQTPHFKLSENTLVFWHFSTLCVILPLSSKWLRYSCKLAKGVEIFIIIYIFCRDHQRTVKSVCVQRGGRRNAITPA